MVSTSIYLQKNWLWGRTVTNEGGRITVRSGCGPTYGTTDTTALPSGIIPTVKCSVYQRDSIKHRANMAPKTASSASTHARQARHTRAREMYSGKEYEQRERMEGSAWCGRDATPAIAFERRRQAVGSRFFARIQPAGKEL